MEDQAKYKRTKIDYFKFNTKSFLDPNWQIKRLEIFNRDEFRCQHCFGLHSGEFEPSENTLAAHHIYYEWDCKNPWDCNDDALITLCKTCHKLEHDFWYLLDRDAFECQGTNSLLYRCGFTLTMILALDLDAEDFYEFFWGPAETNYYLKNGEPTDPKYFAAIKINEFKERRKLRLKNI